MALLAFYNCKQVSPFWSLVVEWATCISPQQLVLLDIGYVVDNVDPPYQGEKRVFLAILAVARMVIWETRNKGLYDGTNFTHRDLILFFRHQLRVKIRYERKRLNRIIRQNVGVCNVPGRTKGGNVGVILPSSSGAWQRWSRSLGIRHSLNRITVRCVSLVLSLSCSSPRSSLSLILLSPLPSSSPTFLRILAPHYCNPYYPFLAAPSQTFLLSH